MTLLLIFDSLQAGSITMEDIVTVSEHAASMGGSQVFFEVNEEQTVETMIKCISIASANDACVAMAEHICGSEEAFVQKMNQKAKELGMNDTTFINCCGLDTPGHVSSAYDIALMSKELMMKYPEISRFTTAWMDKIIHTTKKGQSEFGLANTNKLVRQYQGITGLKTGSTANAKYCLSATANREDICMIAVILAAPDTKTRFQEAAKLLNHGYSICERYVDKHDDFMQTQVKLIGGIEEFVEIKPKQEYACLLLEGESEGDMEERVTLYEKVKAPIAKNEELGVITYYKKGIEVGKISLIAVKEVRKATYLDYLIKVLKMLT